MRHVIRQDRDYWKIDNLNICFVDCIRNLWIGLQKGVIADVFFPDVKHYMQRSDLMMHIYFSSTCWRGWRKKTCWNRSAPGWMAWWGSTTGWKLSLSSFQNCNWVQIEESQHNFVYLGTTGVCHPQKTVFQLRSWKSQLWRKSWPMAIVTWKWRIQSWNVRFVKIHFLELKVKMIISKVESI